MITSLRIENFALIDAVEINFNSGFTVITGETGSGKSILLNALNLILGERANFSVIGANSDKSVVEADVSIKGFEMERFFQQHELDYFDNTIIRREINKAGRSRAFINDVPVQLAVLKDFSSQLIHIHSQYNTLELKDIHFQMKVLDVLAGVAERGDEYKMKFASYKKSKLSLEQKKEKLAASISQADYNAFQLNELELLQLNDRNYNSMIDKVQAGQNADEIKSIYAEISTVLSSENNVIDNLTRLKSILSKKSHLSSIIKSFEEQINSMLIEAQDVLNTVEDEIETFEFDEAEFNENIEMVDTYQRVCQKHNVNSQEDLIQLMKELSDFSQGHEELNFEIEELSDEIDRVYKELLNDAEQIHTLRLNAIKGIESEIKSALVDLKLKDTELIFDLEKDSELTVNGLSKLQMLFSPNVGVPAVPVHKAASGGELSRVMLALQSLMSSKIKLRSVLFDEIDTGVSGDVAQKMGTTLKRMGEGMQVIAITHLPQVSAKGGQHFKVFKEVVDGQTKTFVKELTETEKVEETARLMSGDEISSAALDNARALMKA